MSAFRFLFFLLYKYIIYEAHSIYRYSHVFYIRIYNERNVLIIYKKKKKIYMKQKNKFYIAKY